MYSFRLYAQGGASGAATTEAHDHNSQVVYRRRRGDVENEAAIQNLLHRVRTGLLVFAFLALSPSSANATLIAGQALVRTPDGLFSDPIAISTSGPANAVIGPNYQASADIQTGAYRARTDIESSNANGLPGLVFSRSRAIGVTFRNDGLSAVSVAAFSLDITSDYTGVAGQSGIFGNNTTVGLSIIYPDLTTADANFRHVYAAERNPNTNSVVEIIDDVTSSASGGGLTTVQNHSSQGIVGTLNLPGFLWEVREVFSFDVFLAVTSGAQGVGNHSITDAFNTAQLSLTLAPGDSADAFNIGNLGTPSWVHTSSVAVPEPSTTALGLATFFAFAVARLLRRRRKRGQNSSTRSGAVSEDR